MKKDERIYFIDALRGILIILMIIYHAMYDIVYLFDIPLDIMHKPIMHNLQALAASLFIIISGISSNFSRNNIKRGIIVFLFAMILTLATFLINNGTQIYFGILHSLGLSMIIYGLLKNFLIKLSKPAGLIIFLLLFFIWQCICKNLNPVQTPHLYIIGLYDSAFYSSDYFPLLPWIFIFFFGTYIGMYIKEHKFPEFFYKIRFTPAEFVGRHTFIIYLLHQPVIYAALYIILRCF